jgi:hypothetical protein
MGCVQGNECISAQGNECISAQGCAWVVFKEMSEYLGRCWW